MGPDGEIGKHSGLKIRRRKAYGFDSRSGHHHKISSLDAGLCGKGSPQGVFAALLQH